MRVMKKSTKAWSMKMRLALLALGGTGVDRRAGERKSGDRCVERYDCKWVCRRHRYGK